MTLAPAHRPRAASFGLVAALLVVGPGAFVVFRMTTTPVSIETFWLVAILLLSLVVAGAFLYWAGAALSLGYRIDPNAVTIRWGFATHTVPLSQITDIVAGAAYGAPRRFAGVRWPGYAIGKGEVDGIGPVMFYSTHRDAADLIYLLTTDRAYALSPADASAFTEALTRAGMQGVSAVAEPVTEFSGVMRFAIWHDRWALAIAGLALAGNLALVAYVLYYYPTLPDLLPLHFNVVGDPDFIGPRQDVFRLPAIAFGLLVMNFVLAGALYTRERLASYIALSVGLLLQAMFWVATTRIVY